MSQEGLYVFVLISLDFSLCHKREMNPLLSCPLVYSDSQYICRSTIEGSVVIRNWSIRLSTIGLRLKKAVYSLELAQTEVERDEDKYAGSVSKDAV